MLYSVNVLRNFQRRKWSVGQPSWIGAPLEIFKSAFSLGVAFQLSSSFTAVSSTYKISWRAELRKPKNAQHFLCLWVNAEVQSTHDGRVQRPRVRTWQVSQWVPTLFTLSSGKYTTLRSCAGFQYRGTFWWSAHLSLWNQSIAHHTYF